MHVRVLLFALFRERLGCGELRVELATPATLADLVASLEAQYPFIRTMAGSYRVALNQQFAPFSTAIADGDEVALIPPVAGGLAYHLIIGPEPLDVARCIAAVTHERAGAINVFIGNVRLENRDQTIELLEYEAYPDMVRAVFRQICDGISAQYPGACVAIEHRTGRLRVGETAVVIAASAPHRDVAFAACRDAIEQLKRDAPIWKKETSTDGVTWLGMGG